MLFVVQITLLVVVVKHIVCQTCLSNESKEDFDKSRKALTDVQENIGKVLIKLENDNKKTLDMFKKSLNTMGQKIKKLDTDFKVLGKDFRKTKWNKYNGHCYYYSSESVDWFMAERKCREIGGYIVKIDNKEENNNIAANRPNKAVHHWIGLIDLKEGEWRWTYDQSKAVFKTWYPSHGDKGTNNNCVMLHGSRTDWFDYNCHYKALFICESNFCF
ncbi:perlucin-like protein isoform X14 [Mytilus californianus]|uniref:perlucin-like protein isoform X14 n=1 Tax=Mytilus californianus TaxID=6549 RepID=UPI00224527FC|nr:perlucin-like protein isoform X14 [Mytilus californianus]